jgi:hypothetical protein
MCRMSFCTPSKVLALRTFVHLLAAVAAVVAAVGVLTHI